MSEHLNSGLIGNIFSLSDSWCRRLIFRAERDERPLIIPGRGRSGLKCVSGGKIEMGRNESIALALPIAVRSTTENKNQKKYRLLPPTSYLTRPPSFPSLSSQLPSNLLHSFPHSNGAPSVRLQGRTVQKWLRLQLPNISRASSPRALAKSRVPK